VTFFTSFSPISDACHDHTPTGLTRERLSLDYGRFSSPPRGGNNRFFGGRIHEARFKNIGIH